MTNPDYLFQQKLVFHCLEHLKSSRGVVLAATPGAGKTEMSIDVIRNWLEENKSQKVLVLTHGQTVLRSQYFNRLQRRERSFSFGMLNSKNPSSEDSVQVALPHHFVNRKVEKYGLIVIDEAHHFFSAPMVQNVLKANPEAKLLMLTGTPSPFIAMKTFPIVSFTASQLLEQGVITDPFIELVKTKLPFTLKNFNKQDNLVEGAEFTSKQVNSSLDSALSQLLNTLTARLKGTRNPKRYFKKLSGKKLKSALAQLDFGKTMVICHRQDQARDVVAYFKAKGISALLSVSDDDTDSANVELFRTDSTKVLVVVNRATLGFDLPSLRNIIDLSMTHNPDRIFQALCRVVRRGLNGEKKTFIKVTTDGLAALTYVVMSFVVALSLPEYYETFDGRWKDRKVRIKRSSGPSGKHTGEGRHKSPWEDLLPLPSLIDIKGMMSADSSLYAYTTFNEVRARLGKGVSKGFWTKERCLEEAKRHQSRNSFQREAKGAYNSAWRNGWYEELCEAVWPGKKVKGFWNKEQCALAAKKCTTSTEFHKRFPGAAGAAAREGWLKEVTNHFSQKQKPTGFWNVERIAKEAAKYQERTKFFEGSPSAYVRASQLGILDEVCKHMPKKVR
jgi:superfamily II DNA or RNA helicase